MENSKQNRVVGVCATVCRFVLAAVFIFSGFVKAVDPLGTQYKIQDYLDAFGWGTVFPEYIALLASVLLGMLEFCLGVYLFFGIRRRIAPRTVALIMSIMTPLTLWLAVDNPVADCGCFGDAVVLSNWATFWKNTVLWAMSLFLLKHRRRIFPLVTVRLDWLIALYSFLYIFCMIVYCYRHLPVFDFRPYHIGADIREGMEIPEGERPTEYETRFVLRKDGVEKEFTLENYPDSTWSFVDSRTVVKEKGYEPPIRDFSVLNFKDGEEITERLLSDEDYSFWVVSHQLNKADNSTADLVNDLYDYSLLHGYAFYCLTSSSDEDILAWKENTGAEYPFGIMDNITLKTMIRSNPGVMLLKDGVVMGKWSANDLPNEEQLLASLKVLSEGNVGNPSFIHKILAVIAWFVFPLFLICVMDLYWEKLRKSQGVLNERNE